MARAGPLASIGTGLIRADRSARDLTSDRRQDQIPLELNAALFERLAGDHEGGDAGFHVRSAEAENLPIADSAAQLTHGLQFGTKHPILFGTCKARIHVAVDLQRHSPGVTFDYAHGVDPIRIDLLPYRFDPVA